MKIIFVCRDEEFAAAVTMLLQTAGQVVRAVQSKSAGLAALREGFHPSVWLFDQNPLIKFDFEGIEELPMVLMYSSDSLPFPPPSVVLLRKPFELPALLKALEDAQVATNQVKVGGPGLVDPFRP